MSSNWQIVLNKYLANFQTETTTALENINDMLKQSGKNYNEEMKSCFAKCVNRSLEQTLNLFDLHISIDAKLPSSCQPSIGHSVAPIETQTMKRQSSTDVQNEASKRKKTIAEKQLKNIMFCCFDCNNQTNIFVDTFSEVYDHWKSCHDSMPFRFVAVGKAACYHCGKVDVFAKLKDHHKSIHPSKIFVVVDWQKKSKCGLCHKEFSKSEMIVHFEAEHKPLHYAHINSPICLNQSEIKQLISLNSSQTEAIAPSGRFAAFMCGYCHTVENICEVSFMQHIKMDPFQFNCSVCPFWGSSIRETTQHEATVHRLTIDTLNHSNILMDRLEQYYLQTRVIFTNGLVLYKHNIRHLMIATNFGQLKKNWQCRN
ncbi:uncharacterized protein LOC129575616 [Sitodiplosis mosellana]|uniref:uncharacterized protein LOC129575616 n=1 Tax=Sitodiplosis mosellana TaxID=263140 RepID=UPI00244435A3|nr:uncharacterized protein LOC129575616 [Sitodiplosis mosellana]